MLRRLGSGEPVARVCEAAGLALERFDDWWRQEARARVPEPGGTRLAGVRRPAEIQRDALGVPHIHAADDEDLFFAFGYAMAQDRLFQLDYLRRRGSGRMSEVLGPDGAGMDLLGRIPGFQSIFELDLLARTVGLRRIALAEWERLPDETKRLLTAFSNGINALMEESRDRLPIEFALLDYA